MIKILSFVIMALFLAGCGRQIIIQDENGKPIKGAVVYVTYPSFSGPQYSTNKNGVVSVGKSWMFDEYGFGVRKDGYDTDEYPWPINWPVYITMYSGAGRRLHGHPFDPNSILIDPQADWIIDRK